VIIYARGCGHQVERDPGELTKRYGTATTVIDGAKRAGLLSAREPAVQQPRWSLIL
jgi:hypothetical protein